MEPVFLTLDEVIEIHEQQVELYGGSHGLRDPAALESAVATPQATFGGELLHASIPAIAAGLSVPSLSEPRLHRRQQARRRERCHHVPPHERLGTDLRPGRIGRLGPRRRIQQGPEAGAHRHFPVAFSADLERSQHFDVLMHGATAPPVLSFLQRVERCYRRLECTDGDAMGTSLNVRTIAEATSRVKASPVVPGLKQTT